MKKHCGLFLTILFIAIYFNRSFSQSNHTCGFDGIHKKNMQNPVYRQQWEKHNQEMQQILSNPQMKSGGIDTIPVVVHVLHLGDAIGTGSNISDAQINSAIQNLNDAYANLTSPNQSVEMGLRFVLAKRDPNCNSTTGIVRVNASGVSGYTQYGVKLNGSLGADENTLKDLSKWPTDKYMNFWIVSEIDNNNGGSGVQGYANLPVGIDEYNGAVMMATAFGYNPGAGMDNSTVVHEVGHFFDLYHPFRPNDDAGEEGICPPSTGNCSVDNDMVCDTDPCVNYINEPQYLDCDPALNNPCTSQPYGNIIYNYMNYTSCPNRFTAGQKTRVSACVTSSRASLASSLGDTPPSGVFTPPIASICTPKTTGVGLTSYYGGIIETKFNNLDKVSGPTNVDNPTDGYMDFTTSCLNVANVQVGQTYTLSVKAFGANDEDIKAWIDYNNDGDFNDATEDITPTVLTAQNSNSYTVTKSVTIPVTATINTSLRMRIISNWNGTPTNCQQNINLGQAEDYTVFITSAATIDCDFSADNTTACANSTINFTSQNISGAATSWNWTVTPSTGVTYTGGTSSTSQHPKMIFANAGTYTISMLASDGTNSETTTKTNYITINASPTVSYTNTDPTCGTNGSVVFNASGTTAPYTLTFDGTVQGGLTVNNLGAGSYNYSVSDNNSCTATGTTTLVSAGGPTVTVAGTDATCGMNNGVGTLTISGNTGAPTISWSSGGSSTVENNLAPGNYTVNVNVDGCTFNLNLTIANDPNGPQINVTSTNVVCGNLGTATANITGNSGTPVYTWSNGGNTATINNLNAGTYSVSVSVDGCTLTGSATITSSSPSLNITSVQPTCGLSNGSLTANVSGNTGTPSYSWSNSSTAQTISNLAPGTYTVTVSVDGCTLTDNATLNNSTSTINVTLNSTHPSCGNNNGSISANVSGNTGVPVYSWSTGSSNACINNLAAGPYSVDVTVDGCTVNASTTLTDNTAALNLTLNAVQPTCGLSNGSVTAVVTGNSGIPTFLWSNSATTQTIANLGAGNYSVGVMVDGCPLTDNVTLTNASISLSLSTTDPTCGGNDGLITSTLTGTTGTPIYTWSNGQTTQDAIGLTPGTYTLNVSVDGCALTSQATLLDNGSDAGVLDGSNWVCLNSDYPMSVTDYNGVILDWYHSTNGIDYTPLSITTDNYLFHVTGKNNLFFVVVQNGLCPADTTNIATLHTFTQPNVDAPDEIEVMSNSTVAITGTASLGTYQWSPSIYFSNDNSLSTNVYVDSVTKYVYLTVVDANGCINTDSTRIFVVDSLLKELKIPLAFSPNGDGINDRLEFFNTLGLQDFNFILYDRWGEMIYTTTNWNERWDGTYKGKIVTSGVYSYSVSYKYVSGQEGKKGSYLEIIN